MLREVFFYFLIGRLCESNVGLDMVTVILFNKGMIAISLILFRKFPVSIVSSVSFWKDNGVSEDQPTIINKDNYDFV